MAQGFQLDYAGMGEYLRGADMLAMVADRGEKVKATAEAIAPYRAQDDPPHYKDCFGMRVDVRPGQHPRACATVYNTSGHALDVEFGRYHTPRYRVLGRALGVA
ncbi:MAG: hypothetical protein ACRDRL_28985 [Sciscionella sp.]